MKFNEKLIELRKKEGLSQEELGYKLNVTRQTVSKWELGQTTPEMEKLIEMSKVFNISVDELINESEEVVNERPIIEDQPIKEKSSKNNKVLFLIVGALIIVVVLIVVKIFSGVSAFNKVGKAQAGIFDRFFGIFDKALDIADKQMDSMNETGDMFNQTTEMFNEAKNKVTIGQLNGALEIYSGTNIGTVVEEVLDSIITNNKKQDRKITVKYMETETQNEQEIRNIKQDIKTHSEYEVSYEYDEEGYIKEVKIEKQVSEFEVSSFNNGLEIYAGSTIGGTVTAVLDNIITSNKTEDRKITVKYMQTETQNEEEIKGIKRNIGTFNKYEITYEYDADGFINKATIEKI